MRRNFPAMFRDQLSCLCNVDDQESNFENIQYGFSSLKTTLKDRFFTILEFSQELSGVLFRFASARSTW